MLSERSPKRVALVTGADLGRGAPGGTRSYVLGLASFLAGRGIGVTILTNGAVHGLPAGCQSAAVTPKHMPSTIEYQRALRRWSSRDLLTNIGLYHFQRPDDLMAMQSPARDLPAVCTLHGDPMKGIRRRHGRMMAMAYRRKEASIITRFRALVAVDERTALAYRQRYPALSDRIHVIPVGVEESSIDGQAKELAAPSHDHALTFLYAGRLSVEKRVDRIISAFLQIEPANKRLIIAGSGSEEERLRGLAEAGNVQFLGNVPHDELLSLYQEADALVLASEFEGMPTVALESIASGCPVVALAGCGLEELLDGRRGVIARDEDHLPHAMENAGRLRRSGNRVELPPEYTWSAVGSRVLALYAKVAPQVIP